MFSFIILVDFPRESHAMVSDYPTPGSTEATSNSKLITKIIIYQNQHISFNQKRITTELNSLQLVTIICFEKDKMCILMLANF